jgi:hypothetical protein
MVQNRADSPPTALIIPTHSRINGRRAPVSATGGLHKDADSPTSAPIAPAYRRQAATVIEVYFEKAGVRLAYLL